MLEPWILSFPSTLIITSFLVIFSLINCGSKKKDPKAPPGAPSAAPVATPTPAAANVGVSAEARKAEELKPHVFEKNEKEKLIAEGQIKRNKHDYPTFDDVVSDWETEDDGEGGRKKKKKKTEGGDEDKKDGDKKSEKKDAGSKSKKTGEDDNKKSEKKSGEKQ